MILKHYKILLLIFLSYVAVLIFYPVLNTGFIAIDDSVMVENNHYITRLSFDYAIQYFTEFHYRLYHPVVNLSYAIEYYFFQLDPYIYHLDNILLHLFNTFFVFFIFKRLTKSFASAYIAAALFAIHPVHVEPVVWITSRKDTLYGFFYLLSVLFYLKTYDNKRIKLYTAISISAFLMSCLSKPMAVTLPLLLVLTDYFQNRINISKIKIYIVFFAVSLFFILFAIYGYYSPEDKYIATAFSRTLDVLGAHFNVLFYIFKFIFPVNLACLYPNFYRFSMPPWYILYAPALLYLILFFIFKSLRYTKKIFFGFMFFIITVLPAIGLLPAGISPVADRYVYLPYIGLFYLFAELCIYIYAKFNKFKYILISFAVLLPLGMIYASFNRVLLWKDSVVLLTDTINKYPDSADHAYSIRGIEYKNANDFDKAEYDLLKSLEINHNNGYSVFALGHLNQLKGNTDKAKEYYSKIAKTSINYPGVVNNMSMIEYGKGNTDKAIKMLENLIVEKEEPSEYIYNNLAVYYYKNNDFDRVLKNLKLAVKYDKSKASAYIMMMKIYLQSNDLENFENAALEGLKNCKPDMQLYNNLGQQYFIEDRFNDAEKIFKTSSQYFPNNYMAYFFLGNISALRNDYKSALKYYTMAILLNKNTGEFYYKRSAVHLMNNNYILAKQDMDKAVKNGFNIDADFKNEIEKIRRKE